jgi:hypothetical protein
MYSNPHCGLGNQWDNIRFAHKIRANLIKSVLVIDTPFKLHTFMNVTHLLSSNQPTNSMENKPSKKLKIIQELPSLLWGYSYWLKSSEDDGFMENPSINGTEMLYGNHETLLQTSFKLKSSVYWDITPCSLLKADQHFGRCHHYLQSQRKVKQETIKKAGVKSVDFQQTIWRYIPELFITTDVRTSNPTSFELFSSLYIERESHGINVSMCLCVYPSSHDIFWKFWGCSKNEQRI